MVGATGATIDGFNRIKDGLQDFKEFKELSDRAREIESKENGFSEREVFHESEY